MGSAGQRDVVGVTSSRDGPMGACSMDILGTSFSASNFSLDRPAYLKSEADVGGIGRKDACRYKGLLFLSFSLSLMPATVTLQPQVWHASLQVKQIHFVASRPVGAEHKEPPFCLCVSVVSRTSY